ncbi:MAG TPA: NUDIX domain-containing protein [Mycobacteriales bacterium]|nr:NUDIX domain-containing protein [Mycobacteriales bacterium]HWA66291.1 NUDIX domain-containing protein [Mycobacteriales bacterium]
MVAVVLSVREGVLSVLMWRRAQAPFVRRWALPGGGVGEDERLRAAILRHLAEKVDVTEVAYLEQLATHSNIKRDPRGRVLATAYLGLVPSSVVPDLPPDTGWHPVCDLPPTAFDHADFISAGVERLRAKLTYTNIGFALAPEEFTMSQLRDVVSGALGYSVTQTNLARVMTRRQLIEPTRARSQPGPAGGRPAMRYRFRSRELAVTDPFAVLKPSRRR